MASNQSVYKWLGLAVLLAASNGWATEQFDAQGQFIADPTTPLGQGEHPRLHVLPDSNPPDPTRPGTLAYLRNKLSRPRSEGGFREDYQAFVNWVDANFGIDDSDGKPGNQEGLMTDYQALLALVGPLPGITYQNRQEEYTRRAIDIAMNRVALPLPDGYGKSGHSFHIDFMAMARTYDWLNHRLTPEEKLAIGNWLAEVGLRTARGQYSSKGIRGDGTPEALWSSSAFEVMHPWYFGLALYGDGVNDEVAQQLMDSFPRLMLDGRILDAQNWAARRNGGPTEVGSYGMWHPTKHIIMEHAWWTATGKNYFAEGTDVSDAYFLRYHPQYVVYMRKPAKPELLLNWGQGGAVMAVASALRPLRLLGEALKAAEPEPRMSALARWLLTQWERADWDNEQDGTFFQLLMGDRTTPARSPDELGLPKTIHFEGIGMVVMRTGFTDPRDAVVVVGAPVYQLGGHTWSTKGGGVANAVPLGFSMDRHGILTSRHVGYHRGFIESQRQNSMRFNDPATIETDTRGGFGGARGAEVRSIAEYTPESPWYRGGMVRLQAFEQTGAYDYVYTDLGRNYLADRVAKYTRQYAYFRPTSLSDSDYLVIFDRVQTTRPEIVKRWEINMAYNPAINGQETQVRPGKWAYTGANQMAITNAVNPDPYSGKTNGGHGVLFMKTLLPADARYEKVGGPGYEFTDDIGRTLPENADLAALKEVGAFYTMTYFVDVIPATHNAHENFLHVLQTADANDPTQSARMVPTSLIETEGGALQGAFIAASAGQRLPLEEAAPRPSGQPNAVVLFSKEERLLGRNEPITYTVSGEGPCRHLIADLPANVTYTITDNGSPLEGTYRTTDLRPPDARLAGEPAAGVLSFTTELGSIHQIRILPEGGGEILPGDTNQDGRVTLADAIQVIKWAARVLPGPEPRTPAFVAADVNCDGRITLSDAILMIKVLARLIVEFPRCG